MNASLVFAIALTRAWTALYTRGLPPDLRAERREEIDCDLWHQQRLADLEREPVMGTAVQVAARLLLGVPADILWRIEAGRMARPEKEIRMNETWTMRGLLVLGLAAAAFPVVIGFLVLIGANGELDATERALYGPMQIVIGLTIICGLILSLRRPGLGIGLIAAGTIAISVVWYWAAMITVPIGIGLLAVAYARARRTGWRWPRGAGLA